MGIFGVENGWLFVSSAQGVSQAWVEERFPGSPDGSVLFSDFRQQATDEPEQIADMIVGRIAIRKYVEQKCGLQDRQARRVQAEMDFLRSQRDVTWTCVASLDNHRNKRDVWGTRMKNLGLNVSSGS